MSIYMYMDEVFISFIQMVFLHCICVEIAIKFQLVSLLRILLSSFKVKTIDNRAILESKKTLRNQVGCHSVILVAEDKGTPKLRGTTKLTLCVMDVNDEAPSFTVPTGKIEILSLKEVSATQEYRE